MKDSVPKSLLLIISASLVVGIFLVSLIADPLSLVSLMSEQDFEDEIDLDEDFETPEGLEDSEYSDNLEDYLERQMEDHEQDLSGFDGLSLEDLFDLDDETDEDDDSEEKDEDKEEESEEEEESEDPDETDEEEDETSDDENGSDEEDEDSGESDEENGDEQDDQQEGENGDQEEVDGDSRLVPEFSDVDRDILSQVSWLILILAAAIASYLVYRSDKNLKQIIKIIASTAVHFIKNLPNLIRDEFVKLVVFSITEIRKLAQLLKNLILNPLNTLKQIPSRIISLIEHFNPVNILTGLNPFESKRNGYRDMTGIDEFWFKFKTVVGLRDENTLTPKEVGIRAVKQGYPEAKVGIAVNKYRYEKFGDRKYKKSIEIDELADKEEE